MSKQLTTEEVREAYVAIMWEYTNTTTEAEEAAFDAWLTAVKAEAWQIGYEAGYADDDFEWRSPQKNPYLKEGDE